MNPPATAAERLAWRVDAVEIDVREAAALSREQSSRLVELTQSIALLRQSLEHLSQQVSELRAEGKIAQERRSLPSASAVVAVLIAAVLGAIVAWTAARVTEARGDAPTSSASS